MKHFSNYSLKSLNTFGVDVNALNFYSIQNEYELKDLCHESKNAFILGGGSNILLLQNLEREVWSLDFRGIEIIKDAESYCLVEVQAGEVWHDLVLWCVDQNLGGIENLALIPGKVGAAPIQNIGAYGVELKDVLHTVHTIDKSSGLPISYFNPECKFGYRDSIFKNALKGKFITTSIVIKLSKSGYHVFNTSYGAIKSRLASNGVKANDYTPELIARQIIDIRESKLPDPSKIGNAGSFFKNPVISIAEFQKLKEAFPSIVSYSVSDHLVKIPAGWLIDKAGWKGKMINNVGCYKNQALVIISNGKATGQEILQFSSDIIDSVFEKYGITLDREVNVIQ